MVLSELASQFAKITNDVDNKNSESTVYGTVKERDGKMYVQLDGSDRLTPMTTTVAVNDGDRVTVLIKNHTATVTGNVSSPSANSSDVTNLGTQVDEMSGKIDEFGIIVADKVSADVLEAERARVNKLVADTVVINDATISRLDAAIADVGSLKADKAEVEDMVVTKLDAKIAEFDYASADDLEATNAKINNLDATYAKIVDLEAAEAQIGELKTGKLDAATAEITYATIENLDATKAEVTDLDADVADINTLIFGSASGDTIHTNFANAVIAQLGNAQIKSAMIEDISASKIAAGAILTNNVAVKSENGKLLISDETIQISDENRVRVQIGKDANNDYSINIWDDNGNLMFSKGGITDKAIKGAIIRNDMVSDNANISASKLDINSLFEEINGSTKTIKSSKIYLDDKEQTLDVAFESMSTTIDDTKETVGTQGTELSVVKNKIESKIWQQDITTAVDGAKTEMNSKYSTVEQDIAGIKTQIGEHTTEIEKKADSTTVTAVTNRVNNLVLDVNGFKTDVSETYATKTELEAVDEKANQNAEDMAQLITNFNSDIEGLQSQIDGSITTWFYEYEPTAENEPASNWTTTDLKNTHLGDLFYNTLTGYCYRWQVLNNVYSWQRITDTDVTKALSDAAKAQDTADSKRRVFYDQPVSPYDKGDLWVQGSTGDILRCNRNIYLTGAFNQSHWEPASKYTDDTKANAVQEELTTKHAQLVQTIEGFKTTVSETYATKTELDLLPYDGRNLILESDKELSGNGYWLGDYMPSTTLIAGETYTISFYVTPAENVTKICVYLSLGYALMGQLSVSGTDPQLLTATFTAAYYSGRTPDDDDKFRALSIYRMPNDGTVTGTTTIHWAKVEKGDKATDWTPAPEDITDIKSRVSTSETKIEQTASSITSLASRTETVENKFGEYSTTTEMNSAIEQKANSVTSTVTEKIENITVGGRNLLRDSRLIPVYSNNSNNYPVTCIETQEDDVTFHRIQRTAIDTNPTTLSIYNTIPRTQYAYSEMVGKQVTLSFKARASEEITCSLMSYITSEGVTTNFSKNNTLEALPTEWKTFVQVIDVFPEIAEDAVLRWSPLHITIPEGKISEFYIDVRDWKFELGNKATDWTPAPEDIDKDISDVSANVNANEGRIATAESSIQQLADQISTLVTDENGVSLMKQTTDGWTFSIGDIQKAISDASEGISSLDGSVDNLGSELDGLKNTVDKLGEFGSYIKIKTDGDQPCIELGSEGSNFKVLITNTDIRFMEGTVVPAYINNQALNIDKAVVEDELQIGGFVWKKRTNGNVGLIWKGDG